MAENSHKHGVKNGIFHMKIKILRPALPSRRRTEPPTGIVMHATAGGTLNGAIETLRQRGLSYHYTIDKDGTVTKCCPIANIAFHSGNSYGPKEADANVNRTQDKAANFIAKCSVNPYTIGISFVNWDNGKDPFTPAQEQSARDLINELKGSIPTLTFITTHARVSPRRKVDPKGYDIEKLAADTGLKSWKPA